MIIFALNGLGNRLRFIFSYRRVHKITEVVWAPDDHCPGHFLDYFEPIEGVQFVTEPSGPVDIIGHVGHWQPDYTQLKPRAEIRERVIRNLETLGEKFTAVHIRRTDATEYAKERGLYTEDKVFEQFIQNKPGNLFIACDNQDTYSRFQALYNDRMPVKNNYLNEGGRRCTPLGDAVVDLYTCAMAANFHGSGGSSFTHLIKKLRRRRRRYCTAFMQHAKP